MGYAAKHKLLTFHGRLWRTSSAPEEWSIGFRISNAGDPTCSQAQVNACDAAFRTRWSALGATNGINNAHDFYYAKLAPQDENGRYPVDLQSYESTRTTLPGTGTSSSSTWPGQCGLVVTLVSIKPSRRGRASKGRVYLPGNAYQIDSGGKISATLATAMSTFVAGLISDLNDVTSLGAVSIFSKVGTGETWNVGWARTGLVVDTHRSRRRQLLETPTADVAVT